MTEIVMTVVIMIVLVLGSCGFIVMCFHIHRNNKLKNFPWHYRRELRDIGYYVVCYYSNVWYKPNRWAMKQETQEGQPSVLYTPDDFYPKLKRCFTYTPNKIILDEEQVKTLFKLCNPENAKLKEKLKEW